MEDVNRAQELPGERNEAWKSPRAEDAAQRQEVAKRTEAGKSLPNEGGSQRHEEAEMTKAWKKEIFSKPILLFWSDTKSWVRARAPAWAW